MVPSKTHLRSRTTNRRSPERISRKDRSKLSDHRSSLFLAAKSISGGNLVDVDDACFLTLESGPWRVRIIFDHALDFNFINARIFVVSCPNCSLVKQLHHVDAIVPTDIWRDACVSFSPFFRSWPRRPTFFFLGSKHTALARTPTTARC